MIFYFAGGLNSPETFKKVGAKNILSSWLEKKEKHYKDFNIFLDSGAFSAYTRGIEIDNDEYIEYIKKWKPEVYAGLDVIGNAKETHKNINRMVRAGLNPIPTFHFGEPFSYLEEYVRKFDYIALGGVAQLRTKQKLQEWLDMCFHIIKKHFPKKIHGFAISRVDLLKRYPFYSCDSTGWLGSRHGFITNMKGMKLKRYEKEMFRRYDGVYGYKKVNEMNIKSFLNLEKEVTELWQNRGITWNN